MNERSSEDRRAFFRLRYPEDDRPPIRSGGRNYQVAEISECGARIVLAGDSVTRAGQPFAGEIRFHDGELVSIEGVVLRFAETEFVVQLCEGVTPKRMMTEQIWLRQKYLEVAPDVEDSRDNNGPG